MIDDDTRYRPSFSVVKTPVEWKFDNLPKPTDVLSFSNFTTESERYWTSPVPHTKTATTK
jgi:hypothetical protein